MDKRECDLFFVTRIVYPTKAKQMRRFSFPQKAFHFYHLVESQVSARTRQVGGYVGGRVYRNGAPGIQELPILVPPPGGNLFLGPDVIHKETQNRPKLR